MRRLARHVVAFTKDFSDPDLFWLNRDCLPEFADLLIGQPSLTALARATGALWVEAVSVIRSCEKL
jgi:hypothetical protein